MLSLPLVYRFQPPRRASLGSAPVLVMLHGIGGGWADFPRPTDVAPSNPAATL
ncbi:MAG: hypothetical protein Q6L60_16015 [Thermostichus sp. HHBFW_bins_43]